MKKDSIITGIIYGIVGPLALFGLLWSLFGFIDLKELLPKDGPLTANFRDRTLALVALSINLFFIKFFKKKRHNESMRGIVFATFAAVIIWIVVYGRDLLVFKIDIIALHIIAYLFSNLTFIQSYSESFRDNIVIFALRLVIVLFL